mmetsp:Transcript_12026/g.22719  ORF Transcript_12026/g.22719 Transcript_12026/m.22719 type:complete len:198 (-) Transcript_12026:41-634(-)
MVDDVVQDWTGSSGGTFLWEYTHDVLKKDVRTGITATDEAVIITDGYDNESSGKFGGIGGYNKLMIELRNSGLKLRMSVLCIGNEDQCRGSQYRDFATATGGVYAQIDPQDSEEQRNIDMLPFAKHMTSSSAERAEQEIRSREGYEKRIGTGDAEKHSWYISLSDESAKACDGDRKERTGTKPQAHANQFKWSTVDI